ncbi:hypothetical protein LTR53_012710 [Teratosphaeriaceae sp. CCFEE 6253]|nr:hypothetical protein LTR53_012710 [Teratosphaeriaceae sp. CCFEE 6253]
MPPKKPGGKHPPQEICIRCPDRENAEEKKHHNDFVRCYQDFPTRPVGTAAAANDPTDLWWGFNSGLVSRNLDLNESGPDGACAQLLKAAKAVGVKFLPDTMDTAAQERDKNYSLLEAKRQAIFRMPESTNTVTITKEALEAALGAAQAETERKKAAKAQRKAGGAVAAVTHVHAPGLSSAAASGSGQRTGGSAVTTTAGSSGAASSTGTANDRRGNPGGNDRRLPLRGNAPPSSANTTDDSTHQHICPRCPINSPYAHVHALTHDGLLDCHQQVLEGQGLDRDLKGLWPTLKATRNSMTEAQRHDYDALYEQLLEPDLKRSAPSLVIDLLQVILDGGTEFHRTPLTRQVAQHALFRLHQTRRGPAEESFDDQEPLPSAPAQAASRRDLVRHLIPDFEGFEMMDHAERDRALRATMEGDEKEADYDIAEDIFQALQREESMTGYGDQITQVTARAALRLLGLDDYADQAQFDLRLPHLPRRAQQPSDHGIAAGVGGAAGNPPGEPPRRASKSHIEASVTLEMPEPAMLRYGAPDSRISRHDARSQFPVDVDRLDPSKQVPQSERYALRADFGTRSTPFEVFVNHFQVNLPRATVLYEYLIDSPSLEWANATRNKRKIFVRDVIDKVPEFVSNIARVASDYRSKVITTVDLLDGGTVREVTVPSYRAGMRGEPTAVTLTVQLNREFPMDEFSDHVTGHNMTYEEQGAAEAMNILVSKAVADGSPDTFMAGNNKFYYRPGWTELGKDPDVSGLIAMRGYFCSVRPSMGMVTLNVNTLTSAFYRPDTIQSYIDYIHGTARPTAANLRDINKHLAKLRVYVNFDRQQANEAAVIDSIARRTKTVHDVADFATFVEIPKPKATDKSKTTVWQHLKGKYPNDCPRRDGVFAVNVGADEPNQKYYLATQLHVVCDQIYRRKLDGNQTSNMIFVARRRPEENRTAILTEGLRSLTLTGTAQMPTLGGLGITVSRDMLSVPARRALPPGVIYAPQQGGAPPVSARELDAGRWATTQRRFIETTHRFQTGNARPLVAFLRVAGPGVPAFERTKYRDGFLNLHYVHGVQQLFADPSQSQTAGFEVLDGNVHNWPARLKTTLQDMKNRGVCLAVLMLPQKNAINATRHATFKSVADQVVGIKSAVLCEASMSKSIPAYMGNYAMKLNLRLGNANHELRPQDLGIIAATTTRPLDCMMLGADVTHPGGSAKGTPSIAAVVGSMDGRYAVFHGQMRLQTAKLEEIEGMADMCYSLFLEWSRRNKGQLPRRVLLYRNGVSESQYKMVRTKELQQLRAGWAKVRAQLLRDTPGKSQPDSPAITAVITAKRHHTRLYPKKETPQSKNGNCLSGTIVDSGITSPYYMDFFLQSHSPLGGTAKPTHYFVVENGMGFSAQQLQDLTNNICYLYGRSTNAVSYAPPAYYADRLCERGRHYLRGMFDKDESFDNLDEKQGEVRARTMWQGGKNGGNPWHPALNGTMFWM